jgi:cholesterol transport system auxiliary component
VNEHRILRQAPAALLLLLSLAGCGSLFHSNAPARTTYELTVDPKPAGAPLAADLAVLAPRVRRGLDNDRIAVLYPDHRLEFLAAARWSGPLDEMMQDLALQAFRASAALHTVDTDASAFESGYWLELEVVEFQAEYPDTRAEAAPTVHVHLVGRVGASKDRRLLGEFDAEAHQAAADNRLDAVVAAYNQATGASLARVVAETTEILGRDLKAH